MCFRMEESFRRSNSSLRCNDQRAMCNFQTCPVLYSVLEIFIFEKVRAKTSDYVCETPFQKFAILLDIYFFFCLKILLFTTKNGIRTETRVAQILGAFHTQGTQFLPSAYTLNGKHVLSSSCF